MECWAPAFTEEMPDDKSDTGEIFIHMDEKTNLWHSRFAYHANVKVFSFENENNILLLKSGENEVSLHVRLDTHTPRIYSCNPAVVVKSCTTQLLIHGHFSAVYKVQICFILFHCHSIAN